MYISETPFLPPSIIGLEGDSLDAAVNARDTFRDILDLDGPSDIQLGEALSQQMASSVI